MIISVAVNGKLVSYVQLPSHSHCQNQEISMLARSLSMHFHPSPVVDLRELLERKISLKSDSLRGQLGRSVNSSCQLSG